MDDLTLVSSSSCLSCSKAGVTSLSLLFQKFSHPPAHSLNLSLDMVTQSSDRHFHNYPMTVDTRLVYIWEWKD